MPSKGNARQNLKNRLAILPITRQDTISISAATNAAPVLTVTASLNRKSNIRIFYHKSHSVRSLRSRRNVNSAPQPHPTNHRIYINAVVRIAPNNRTLRPTPTNQTSPSFLLTPGVPLAISHSNRGNSQYRFIMQRIFFKDRTLFCTARPAESQENIFLIQPIAKQIQPIIILPMAMIPVNTAKTRIQSNLSALSHHIAAMNIFSGTPSPSM